MKTIALVAGEVSGDYLGAELIRRLKDRCENIHFMGIAGPQMQAAGCEPLYPAEKLSVMGFTESLGRLPEIYGIRRKFCKHLLHNPPDLFIGIDAPDFNLGLEEKLKLAGIRTIHYVSPSVWAWRVERIHKIHRAVDEILALFPFEADFYKKYNIPVTYVGHPLADIMPLEADQGGARHKLQLEDNAYIIGVLPGSRITEIKKIGPIFCEAIRHCHDRNPDFSFIVPMATPAIHGLFTAQMQKIIPNIPIRLFDGQARDVITASNYLMVASGTAALEALLCKRPMVVAYKMAASTWWYMKRKFIVDRYSLPNHLCDRDIVKEYYQEAADPEGIAGEILRLHENPDDVRMMKEAFFRIHRYLRCNASERAAEVVLRHLECVDE